MRPRLACVLVVVGLSVAAGCDDGEDDAAAGEEGSAATTLPGRFEELREGRVAAGDALSTRSFEVPFDVTVAAPLYGFDTDAVVVLAADPEDIIRGPWLTFSALDRVQVFDDPLLAPGELDGERIDGHLRPLPNDVGAWMLQLPALGATERPRTELSGHEARAFDFAVDDVPSGRGPCTDYECLAFDYTDGELAGVGVLAEGVQGRAFLVPADAPRLLILAGADRSRWGSFEPTVDATLESLDLR